MDYEKNWKFETEFNTLYLRPQILYYEELFGTIYIYK